MATLAQPPIQSKKSLRVAKANPTAAANSKRLLLLLLATGLMLMLAVAVGSVNIPIGEVLRGLLGQPTQTAAYQTIIVQFRLPRVLTALLAGAALAAGGLQMQTLFRNPLADPFVLGITSGASLGVAAVVLASVAGGAALFAGLGSLGQAGLSVAAAVGAGLALAIVMAFAAYLRQNMALLILGLMFGYATGAIVSLLMYFSVPEQVQAYVRWTFGSFGGVSWRQLPFLAAPVIVGLLVALASAKELNALLLGERYAQSMGLAVGRTRLRIIFSTALLAGAVTAFCGPIGFLGLAVPHLGRALFRTSDHRVLLPACMLLGSIFAAAADLVAQMPGSSFVLPLNAVTALFGAPLVIAVIMRGRAGQG
jgi:iron complex transport system permease protein